jgi:hypothetical protein
MCLIYGTEGFYIYKGITSKKQVYTKLKEHLHCSSRIIIKDESSRVTSMDESNFVQFFFILITIIYFKMSEVELVRLVIDAVR